MRNFYGKYIHEDQSSKLKMKVWTIGKNGKVIEYRDNGTKDKINFYREYFDLNEKSTTKGMVFFITYIESHRVRIILESWLIWLKKHTNIVTQKRRKKTSDIFL